MSLYRTIEGLALDRFIDCVCNQNFSALIKDEGPWTEIPDLGFGKAWGHPERGIVMETDLAEAWTEIFLEYIDASRDARTRYKITLGKDIAVLRAKITQIDGLLFVLQTIHSEEAAQMLRDRGNEDLKLDPSDLEQYFLDLNMARDRSREIAIDLKLLEIEQEELEASDQKQEHKKADRAYFLNILSRIATYKHVARIRTSEIDVAEFCAMLTEYLDHIKALKAANSPKPRQ